MAIRLAALEIVLLSLGICATVLRWVRPLLLDWTDVAAPVGQALTLAFACGVSFYYNDLYDMRKVRRFSEFSARLIQSLGVSFILLAAFYTLFPDARLAQGPFLSSLLVLASIVLPIRIGFFALMKVHAFDDRVLILGTSPLAWKIAEEIETSPHLGYCLVGFVDDVGPRGSSAAPDPPYPMLGPLDQLGKLIDEVRPDRIIVALAERRSHLPVQVLLGLRMTGIEVEEGVAVHERLTQKLAIETLTPSYLIFSRDFEKPRFQEAIRRVISLTIAAIGLLLASPVMVVIALLIKLDSEGPVFFVQDRIGLRGRTFRLLKFRTMHPVNGETSEWVQDNSDRITRVGKWLRKFRLDELPQFVNILRGDMNLVGPRPHPVSNFEVFREKIPYYALRLMVRPGVTGWAQIRYGYANNLEEEIEKMRYDLYYIKHMSLWFDVRILFDTVKTVLFGRGAKAADAYWTETPMGAHNS